jgi:hypothetical protein
LDLERQTKIPAKRVTADPGFTPDGHNVRQAAALTVAGIWLVLVAFTSPVIPKGDGYSMFTVAESIVNQSSITVPPDLGRLGRGGRY